MQQKDASQFYIGTSNIVLPVPNKAFYPEEYQDKSRLHFYASMFNTLEINSSFYKIPQPKTVARWAADVPDDFVFTFKLWQGITHAKELMYANEDIDRFLLAVDMVAEKKGCLLVQFPHSVQFSFLGKVSRLLLSLKDRVASAGWGIAVEFRHTSWYRDEIFHFFESNDFGLVQHDMPASGIFFPELESSFVFLRFHGEKGGYSGSYSKEFLDEYADYIRDWTKKGKMVFAYFNNTIGDAVHNALTLQKILKSC